MADITVTIGPLTSTVTVDDAVAEDVARKYLDTLFGNDPNVDLDAMTNKQLLDLYVKQLIKHTNQTVKARLFEDARIQSIEDVKATAPEWPETDPT